MNNIGYYIFTKLDYIKDAENEKSIRTLTASLHWKMAELGLVHDKNIDSAKFIFVLGGDGTMINAISKTLMHSSMLSPVIIGINMGTLGFLTPFVDAPNVDNSVDTIVDMIKNNSYHDFCIERIAFNASAEVEINHPIAVNEFAFKTSNGALGQFDLSIKSNDNLRSIGTYAASGIIVSTPSGSTGLSLSSGGSIIDSSLACAQISFINPRSMSVRPIIVSAEYDIVVTPRQHSIMQSDGVFKSTDISANNPVNIDLDGKTYDVLHPNFDLFESLESKLGWNA